MSDPMAPVGRPIRIGGIVRWVAEPSTADAPRKPKKARKPRVIIGPPKPCARCGDKPRRNLNAYYCTECAVITRKEAEIGRDARRKVPCACGGLKSRRAKSCQQCSGIGRPATTTDEKVGKALGRVHVTEALEDVKRMKGKAA